MALSFFFDRWRACAIALAVLFSRTLCAQSQLPAVTVSLDTLAEFGSPASNWQIAGGIGGDPRREATLSSVAGRGVLINAPTDVAHAPLATTWEHGDIDLDLDFLLPADSHAGILLQGRYGVELADGGRAPGLWQHLHLEFQAPRFDASGKKTQSARLMKVAFNDFVTAEDVEVASRMQVSAPGDERPLGPLVFTGEGPVALRSIKYKRYDPTLHVGVENLAYKLYLGEFSEFDVYSSSAPKSEGTPPSFAADAVERSGKFALVFSGDFIVPRAGAYAFSSDMPEPVRLVVDGQTAVLPLDRGGVAGPLNLTAGKHSFRLDFLHTSWRPPAFRLSVEGPQLAPQMLVGRNRERNPRAGRQLLIEPPKDRVRVQRSFVPFEPKKRLYAINVGTPEGIHYAYDFETGTILRAWRGHFLDTFEMWDGRGENQIAKAAGPALTFNAKPTVALLERSSYDWPDAPEALWNSQGYLLEPDGQPVFLATLASLTVRDRIAPTSDGRGLVRKLDITGPNTEWETWVLLAEADRITPQPDSNGFIVGDRAYYIDVPADATAKPIVRTRNGRQQLVVPVPGKNANKSITYTISW